MKRKLNTTVEVFEKELSYIKHNVIREMTAFAIENINMERLEKKVLTRSSTYHIIYNCDSVSKRLTKAPVTRCR